MSYTYQDGAMSKNLVICIVIHHHHKNSRAGSRQPSNTISKHDQGWRKWAGVVPPPSRRFWFLNWFPFLCVVIGSSHLLCAVNATPISYPFHFVISLKYMKDCRFLGFLENSLRSLSLRFCSDDLEPNDLEFVDTLEIGKYILYST